MQELTLDDVVHVSGGGTLFNTYNDIKSVMLDLPSFFDGLIGVTVDIACRISGDC